MPTIKLCDKVKSFKLDDMLVNDDGKDPFKPLPERCNTCNFGNNHIHWGMLLLIALVLMYAYDNDVGNI